MLDHVIKIKNACVALVSALLCAGAVILGCTVPVFAEDPLTSISITTVLGDSSVRVLPDESGFEVIIPLYAYTNQNAKYLKGTVWFTSPYSFYQSTTSNQIYPSYFEPAEFDTISSFTNTQSGTTILLTYNNYYETGAEHLVGYYHFDIGSNTSTVVLATPSGYSSATNINIRRFFVADTYADIEDQIINALTNSADIQELLEIIDSIGTDTKYLGYIFTNLQTNHNALYTLIQNVWNTEQAVLSVNTNTYNAVLGILAHLNNQYGTQESQVANIADDVEQELDDLAHDISIITPSNVADIGDTYVNQIDTTYNSSVFGFLSNNIIILMLCIVFSFAILSYMLYGGR